MITITQASESQLPIIRQIAEQTWPTAYSAIISPEQIQWMLEWMYNLPELTQQYHAGTLFFIAMQNQVPLGMASISPVKEGICKLNKLYVLPSTQKTGAGKLLLHTAIQAAAEQHATHVQLQVNRANPAVGFYQKQGFVIIAEEDFDIGNGFFMNDYIMQLTLSGE
jgi:diamine N-acetyltransferase